MENLYIFILVAIIPLLLAIYVVSAFCMMKLLKTANHRHPFSAWVPLWNSVSLYQLGGIRTPWAWTLTLISIAAISNFLTEMNAQALKTESADYNIWLLLVSIILSLVSLTASITLAVWWARAIQAAVGVTSTAGGVVLAIFIPLAWLIWMAVSASKNGFNLEKALALGSTFPLRIFGDSDTRKPFVSASPVFTQPVA